MNLEAFSVFVQIVEKGSLAAAGRELGLSPTTVSERLSALEAHYNVTLLHRTTRSVSLTEEGRVMIEGARKLLTEAENLDVHIRLGATALSGLIKVSAPSEIGRATIAPVLDAFIAENPEVSVELMLTDGYINIVEEGVDIAIRFGSLTDSTLRARKLFDDQRIVCASPEYLTQCGVPQTPDELVAHNCLVMRFGSKIDNIWRFRSKNEDQRVVVHGNRIVNDGGLVHTWCLEGRGIALKSHLNIGEDLKSGALVELLKDYSPGSTPVQMLFPPGRMQPKRVQALASALSENLAH